MALADHEQLIGLLSQGPVAVYRSEHSSGIPAHRDTKGQ